MKLWMKFTLSILLGVIAAVLISENQIFNTILLSIAELSLRAGRFLIFPMVFFTLAVSVCQLRRDGSLGKVMLKLVLMTLAAAVLYTVIAVGISFVLPVDRIPILTDSEGWKSEIPFRNDFFQPVLSEYLRQLVPVNAFRIFQQSGDFLLPALLFSFLLGTQLFHDREEAEPVYNLFDSFSRMFYKMNGLYINLLIVTAFSLSYTSIHHALGISDFSSYFSLIRIVLLSALIIMAVVQPLAYFLITRNNPYKELKTFLPAVIISLFSGDNFINMTVLIHTLKENAGIKRKISGLTIPFLTLFSKAGSALITALSLLTILKSYSSLELTVFQITWVIGISILVSIIIFSQSYLGIYSALLIACTLYGRGLQDGYVLILPVLPVLILIAGLLDTSSAAYLTLIFGDNRDFRIPEDPVDYI